MDQRDAWPTRPTEAPTTTPEPAWVVPDGATVPDTGPGAPPVDPTGAAPPFATPGYGPPGYGSPGYGPPGYGPPGYGPPGYGPPGYGPAPGWGGPQPQAKGAWMGLEGGPAPVRWGMGDIFLGLGAWLAVQLVVYIGGSFLIEDKIVLTILALLGSWVGMGGYLVLISHRKGRGSLRVDFGWDFAWIDPFLGFGAGIVTLIAAGMVRVIVAQLFQEPPGTNADRIFGGVEQNHVALVLMAVMAAVGAPIFEELFFRGLALRSIERRFGAVVGVIGSSLLFAMLHWQPGSLGSTASLVAGILVYGLVFAVLTRWQKRLGPSTFAHMTINTIASAFLLYSVFSGHSIV